MLVDIEGANCDCFMPITWIHFWKSEIRIPFPPCRSVTFGAVSLPSDWTCTVSIARNGRGNLDTASECPVQEYPELPEMKSSALTSQNHEENLDPCNDR